MGITPCGKNISAIKDSLKRLKNTLVDAEETFFDNKKKRYVSVRLTLLRGLISAGEDDENGGTYGQNYVIFDETILSNLNCGYVMILDVDCLRTLKTNIAKQLYAHLAYRFYLEARDGDEWWPADYEWLAIHLGIKPQTELWRAKQQLEPAHEELKSLGYIDEYRWDGWRVIYRPGPVWKGEQLRRQSGSTKHSPVRKGRSTTRNQGASPAVVEPYDPLIPVLSAFASGLPIGEQRIKELGLTPEQARMLCEDRHLLPPSR
jgi:hypothetical protein